MIGDEKRPQPQVSARLTAVSHAETGKGSIVSQKWSSNSFGIRKALTFLLRASDLHGLQIVHCLDFYLESPDVYMLLSS